MRLGVDWTLFEKGSRLRPEPSQGASGIYLGLGSNLGDRLANLRLGCRLMEIAGIGVTRASSLYETEPVGPPQPDYLNAVCRVETDLAPEALLVVLKKIETEAGRVPGRRWGPRELDLDVLLYRDLTIESEDLTIPHRELLNRPFVLLPLLEIAPALTLPSGEPLVDYLHETPAGVKRYGSEHL